MLNATGIVRKVDPLGRVVLPIALRREQGIEPKDALEISVDGNDIIVQKYFPGCVFCGEHKGMSEFKGKIMCRNCVVAIASTRDVAD